MRILHHGAVHGVTGSAHELQFNPTHSLLIDCGLFQGGDRSPHGADANDLSLDFDISAIQALVVTHVHIDHVGRIPWLLAAGFNGPILCSEPSAHLLPIVLEDAFRLSFSRRPADLERYLAVIRQRLVPLPYNTWHTALTAKDSSADGAGQVRVRLQRAGHILGSAYVECDVRRPGARPHRVVFSGDLGAPHAPMLPAPKPPHGCDTLVIESTYGDRQHDNRRQRTHRLRAVLERALADDGTVLIPAFSIGRTQELLYELETLVSRLPGLPVILDSPLASRFTQAYRELKPYWSQEALKRVANGHRPLSFEQLLTVDEHDAHERMVAHLRDSARPAIVISGSGMCTGGRIVNYLKAMLGDPRHNVLFVGYQGAGTPGRALQQAGQGGHLTLDGERLAIRAGVHTISGYSAHADQRGLVRFVTGMRRRPGTVRIVHGDRTAREGLREALRQALGSEIRLEIPTPTNP